MRVTRPLFTFDPGWCFLLAGLALLTAAAVIPEQAKVHALRGQLRALDAVERSNTDRLSAYTAFSDDIRERDEAIMRRLAASQLNLVPAGTKPILVASSIDRTVTDWVDATLPPVAFEEEPFTDSLLSRWVLGPSRLWVLAIGACSVFVGLILSIPASRNSVQPAVP